MLGPIGSLFLPGGLIGNHIWGQQQQPGPQQQWNPWGQGQQPWQPQQQPWGPPHMQQQWQQPHWGSPQAQWGPRPGMHHPWGHSGR